MNATIQIPLSQLGDSAPQRKSHYTLIKVLADDRWHYPKCIDRTGTIRTGPDD